MSGRLSVWYCVASQSHKATAVTSRRALEEKPRECGDANLANLGRVQLVPSREGRRISLAPSPRLLK